MNQPEDPYSPPEQPVGDVGPAERYADVPWFRKNSFNSLMVLLGLCCSPAILVVCVIVLTGDVYLNKHDADGRLKRWSVANKVVAVLILVAQVAYLGFVLLAGLRAA